MINQISLEELTNDLTNIYQSDHSRAQVFIETYLGERLKELSSVERVAFVEKLTQIFKDPGADVDGSRPKLSPEKLSPEKLSPEKLSPEKLSPEPHQPHQPPEPAQPHQPRHKPQEEFSRFVSLLLGEKVAQADLSSSEFLEKLVSSLNVIFNTINQIICVINATLLGQRFETGTIRQIIGSTFGDKDKDQAASIKNYLDQIKTAFLISHQAFKQAARNKTGEIMVELDPDRLEAANSGGLMFGPLRRARLYEIYKEQYQTLKHWYESGRVGEEFLREFEKICQEIYRDQDKGEQNEKMF